MNRAKHLSEIADPKQARARPLSAKSQGLVEFALILPILLLTIFVIVELARVLHAWLAIENGARFGVRYAVTQEYDVAYCSAVVDDKCEDQTEEPFAQLQSIKDAAKAGAVAILRNESSVWNEPGYFKVNVCTSEKYEFPHPTNPASPFGLCDPDEDPGEPGQFVSVTVDFNHPLITPMLTAVWPQLSLSSRREAIVEEFRTSRVVDPPEGLPTLVPTNTYTVTPTFTLVPTDTPTVTPSLTHTPTITPTPDCSDLRITGMWTSGDQVRANVRNDSLSTAYLIDSYLEWPKLDSDMKVGYFEFNGQRYGGDDSSSPTSWPAPSIPFAGGGNTDRWAADFDNEPYRPIWGSYYLELTFEFPDVDTCLLSRSYFRSQPPTSTPRPTSTTGPPVPTRTPTPDTPEEPTPTPTDTPTEPTPTLPPPPATNTLPPPPGD
jgi:Flp pilus assembly protein TadG